MNKIMICKKSKLILIEIQCSTEIVNYCKYFFLLFVWCLLFTDEKCILTIFDERMTFCTVLQDGQFAALRNNYWSLNFVQIFYDFLQPKPPILWIFDYFSNKSGQNRDFLGLKLSKFPNIFLLFGHFWPPSPFMDSFTW